MHASGLLQLRTTSPGHTTWCFVEPGCYNPAPARAKAKTRPKGSKEKENAAAGRPQGKQLQPTPIPTSGPATLAAGSTLPPQAGMKFIEDPGAGQCVGTLRWSSDAPFPPLPPWCEAAPPSLSGWRDYLECRMPPDASGTIRVQPPMLDGMSYPLTLVHAMRLLRLQPPRPGPFVILIIGASSKAEERLLRDSNYWEELLCFLPGTQLELVFVGPEVDAAYHERQTERGQLSARCFKGTLGQLLDAEPRHTPDTTLVVGFNTGMGSGLYPLMSSWLPDLLAILRHGFVAIFSCANDYSDLKGELLVFHELLRANVVLPPRRNPFKAATVVREDERERCEWSCSSSFFYAVQGRTEGAPPLPPAGDGALEDALRKLAKKHKRTQTPTEVP